MSDADTGSGCPWDGPLVVGYGDPGPSHRAISYAQSLAATMHVPLHVLHVVDLEDLPGGPDGGSWDEDMRTRERELDIQLRAVITLPDDRWSCRVVRGDPWQSLVAEGDEHHASMIVVGQRTHAHLIGAAVVRMLGSGFGSSVAANLIRRAGRPVLVVPEDEED